MRKTLLCASLGILLWPLSALADFAVRWEDARDGSEALFAGALRDSGIVEDATAHEQLPLQWPDELTLVLGGDGLPRYDNNTQEIHLPYHYLAQATRAQSHFEESRTAALHRGLDVVEYTLYHLLGHALLGGHDVDNDAEAERLATWLMVTQFMSGGEQWLEDIVAFGRASQRLDGPLEDYWHSHGLSKRGAERLNCLVIGQAPGRYVARYPGLTESPEQAAACESDWTAVQNRIETHFSRR